MSFPASGRAVSIRPRDRQQLASFSDLVLRRQIGREEILARQAQIHQHTLALSRVIERPNFQKVANEDLRRMIYLYDEYFFDSRLMPLVEAEGVEFRFSSRMTSSAGKMTTRYPNGREGVRRFSLTLSSTLLFQTFSDVDRRVFVTGRECQDRLEAMQRAAEHELVHLVEILIWNEGECSRPRFQSIANRFFGHTDYRHDLITQSERAARKFNIRVGDSVEFAIDGKKRQGRVNRITRRATVLVPSSSGERFSDGHCYEKYYVPLESLRRIRPK